MLCVGDFYNHINFEHPVNIHVQLMDDWMLLDAWLLDLTEKSTVEIINEVRDFVEDCLIRPYGYIHLEIDEVTFLNDEIDDTLLTVMYDHSR